MSLREGGLDIHPPGHPHAGEHVVPSTRLSGWSMLFDYELYPAVDSRQMLLCQLEVDCILSSHCVM